MDKTRVTIITTLISSLATVLVAFIGIVPQMRMRDQQTISTLQQQIAELQQRPTDTLYTLSGHVSRNKKPVSNGVLIAAAPNESATLGDNGEFLVQSIPRKAYWIIVTTQDGPTSRLLINPDDSQPDTTQEEIAISYNFTKE
jgi:hypothetical protein